MLSIIIGNIAPTIQEMLDLRRIKQKEVHDDEK
jgi:hypothetical protein